MPDTETVEPQVTAGEKSLLQEVSDIFQMLEVFFEGNMPYKNIQHRIRAVWPRISKELNGKE